MDDSAGTGELHELVSQLHAGDLGSFVERRSSMAKQLRADGRRDDAAFIAKVRKPTLAAWAIDASARANPEQVEALLRVGDRLRQAQDALLAGGSPAALRSALDDRRKLVRILADDAVTRVGAAGGNGDAARDDIVATFEAASLDEDVARELVAGQLAKTARVPVGFDLLAMGASADVATEPPAATTAADERRRARTRAREARAAADAASEAVSEQRDEVTRLEAEVERVQRELDRARAALDAAEAAAVAAETDAAEADRAAKG